MGRTSIEECWWTDPRRSLLVKKVGSEELADGVALRAWRLAQEFWKCGRGLVPMSLFEALPHHQELIDSRLADVRDSFVYVRGSSAYLDWIREQREIAKKAGKKSAEIRKAKHGTAQPNGRNVQKAANLSNGRRTESNGIEPSVSVSVSDSVSNLNLSVQKTRIKSRLFLSGIQEIYEKYPNKKGKAQGLATLTGEIKTNEDLNAFSVAVNNYVSEVKKLGREKQYILKFNNFVKQWRDYVEVDTSLNAYKHPGNAFL